MDIKEFDALVEKVGIETAQKIKAALQPYEAQVKALAEEVDRNKGGVTVETFTAFKKASEESLDAVKGIAEKQGVSLSELAATLGNGKQATKSISQVFAEDKEEIRKVFAQGQGTRSYMVTMDKNGNAVMNHIDMTSAKAAGAEATISGVGSGNVSAITQALDAATLIRIGGNAQIFGQYRNTSWVFDLCNTINASFNSQMPFVLWFDEQPKVGGSTLVAEGTTKPASQYLYTLHSDTYKKEATIVGMTDEFQMDFSQLESDIMNKARIDVINRVNSAILPRIIAAATPYNTELSFRGGTGPTHYIDNVNGFDAIAAMAAQVDNATFGARANAAVMSTFKKYRLGITKNTQGTYLNPPAVLDGISFVGNPAMAADALLVGDFKQYNIILRGGLIVKVGYNGNDFANNMFSVVLEQYYFDYISSIRKVAIVNGPTFDNVMNTLTDDQGSI